MRRAFDMVGMKFGKWTVLERGENNSHGVVRWLCRCECGNECLVSGHALRIGGSKQCAECRSTSLVKTVDPNAVRAYKPDLKQRARYKTTGTKLRLWKLYRLTPEEYDTILKYQGGVCACCGKPPKKIRLAVDHCHKTGRVRGLLCWPCNHALGILRDAQDTALGLANYLATPTAPQALGKEVYGLIGKAKSKKKMIYGSPDGPIKPAKKGKS